MDVNISRRDGQEGDFARSNMDLGRVHKWQFTSDVCIYFNFVDKSKLYFTFRLMPPEKKKA